MKKVIAGISFWSIVVGLFTLSTFFSRLQLVIPVIVAQISLMFFNSNTGFNIMKMNLQ